MNFGHNRNVLDHDVDSIMSSEDLLATNQETSSVHVSQSSSSVQCRDADSSCWGYGGRLPTETNNNNENGGEINSFILSAKFQTNILYIQRSRIFISE